MGCEKPYYAEIGSAKPELWREMKPFTRLNYDGTRKPGPMYEFRRVPQAKYHIPNMAARYIIVATPCRKCHQCLRNRQKLWAARARTEITLSSRTWFGTLTINPHWRFILSCRSGSRDFHQSYREVGKEVTKYFKRLRKEGHRFRYLMVMEAHKNGYPHVHLFIHEIAEGISKRELQSQWQLGYSSFKLVDETEGNAARYVTKYLSKDARHRIRGSIKYGKSGND